MIVLPNVTEQKMVNSAKLAEQQKNHRAPKVEKRILKQTHDVQLAETFKTYKQKIKSGG